MKSLAVDTASNVCSVSILENDKLIDKIELNNGRTHSENFMKIVDEIFKRNNISLDEISFISCDVGPGSFTGIRIGLSSIKAIAEVKNIPTVSVTSLETLAYNMEFSKLKNEESKICTLIDARNNQVYAGIFDSTYEKLDDFMADDIDTVLEKIKKYDNIVFIGNGAVLHKNRILASIKEAKFIEENLNEQTSESVGKKGYIDFEKGITKTSDEINPIYLRKSQAERLKK